MKQISVYDLYRLSTAKDNVLIDTFIRQQLVGEEAPKTPPREKMPGVAPGVKQEKISQ